MPASICPVCNYANMDSTEECINCGVPLLRSSVPVRRTMPEEGYKKFLGPEDVESTLANPNVVSSTPGQQAVRSARPERVPAAPSGQSQQRAPVARAGQTQELASRDGEQRAVVSYQEPALAAASGEKNPYENSMDLQPYYPQPSPFQTRVLEEEAADEPEPWKTDRLPWYFSRRRPHLSGRIISTRNEMEFPDFPNVLRALADLMSEFLWIAANQPSHREGERIQITIVRIRTSDGHLKDARLMGYMRGADLTLGDQVSFWGWRRRGSLMVKRGYNHTSKATIVTNMMSMFVPGLILLSVVAAFFVFMVYKADFFSFIHSFFRIFGH